MLEVKTFTYTHRDLKSENKVIAEYALKDISKPMGISEYIPGKIKSALPTIEELEKELEERRD